MRVKLTGNREWTPAIIRRKHSSTPRSYVLTTETGQILRRNKCMINKTGEAITINFPYQESDPSDDHEDTKSTNSQPPEDYTSIPNSLTQPDQDNTPNTPIIPRRSNRPTQPPAWHKDYLVSKV